MKLQIRKYFLPVFWCIYLILFLLLGRYDLSFSEYLTANRIPLFAEWGQHISLLPGSMVMCFCCFVLAGHESGYGKYIMYAGALTASLIGGWQTGNASGEMRWIISGTSALLLSLLMHEAARRTDPASPGILNICRIGLLMTVLSVSCISVLKYVWARPRFWALGTDGRVFMPWYRISGPALADEADKSFPSGHTASSAVIFWISYLPDLFPRFRNRKKSLYAFATVWIVLTALARIMAGMHYITDTMAGFAVSLSIFLMLRKKLFSENEEKGGTA